MTHAPRTKEAEALRIAIDALKLYSNEKDWEFYCGCCARGDTPLEKDHVKKAREALKTINEILKEEK